MKRYFVAAVGLMASVVLYGQTAVSSGTAFQYFSTGPVPAAAFPPGPPGAIAGFKMMGIEGMGGAVVTGKPLSANEERHTLQVLGDGTRIENTETNNFFRDDQGRTRTERSDGTAVIQNPVDGFVAELNANAKTVRKMSFRVNGKDVSFSTSSSSSGAVADPAMAKAKMAKESAEFVVRTGDMGVGVGEGAGAGTPVMARTRVLMLERNLKTEPAPNEESLGIQSVNGVTAQGTRTGMTIATGQIGNDRPIQVVSERWFSTDLQMLVKSSNSDPRFGETTYNLTNINQVAPDPSLFQIPADYTAAQGR